MSMPAEATSETPQGLTRFSVFLTPRAHEALRGSARSPDETQADITNRALVMYYEVTKLLASGGGILDFQDVDGQKWTATVRPSVGVI